MRLLFLSFGMCVSARAEPLQQRYVMRGASLGLPGVALDCTWQYHSRMTRFSVFMTLRWLSTPPENNWWSIPSQNWRQRAKEGDLRKRQKVVRKWEAERHLLFKEQYSNREVRNEARGRAVWKENNSQLLRRRMPWLQTDWAINRLIIYSLLIASVRGPSVRSLISAAPCIVTHHTSMSLGLFLCVCTRTAMHGSESWPPARDVCVCDLSMPIVACTAA